MPCKQSRLLAAVPLPRCVAQKPEVCLDLGETVAAGDRRYVVRALADDRFAARSGSDGVEFKVCVKGAALRTRVGSLAFASDHRPAVFRPPIGIALVPRSTHVIGSDRAFVDARFRTRPRVRLARHWTGGQRRFLVRNDRLPAFVTRLRVGRV